MMSGTFLAGPPSDWQGRSSMRIVAVVAVVWLLIGFIAAAQRDYFKGGPENCAHAGRVIVTVIAGPLNYVGVNPKVHCKLPEPSK
jgi:hypothetical protein